MIIQMYYVVYDHEATKHPITNGGNRGLIGIPFAKCPGHRAA